MGGNGVDYSNLISGAVGAVIGGTAAILGGVVANRRETIRAARLEVFERVLAGLGIDHERLSPGDVREGLEGLRRLSARLTRGDRRGVKEVQDRGAALIGAWSNRISHQSFEMDSYGDNRKRIVPPEFEVPFQDAWSEFQKVREKLETRLEGKIL